MVTKIGQQREMGQHILKDDPSSQLTSMYKVRLTSACEIYACIIFIAI